MSQKIKVTRKINLVFPDIGLNILQKSFKNQKRKINKRADSKKSVQAGSLVTLFYKKFQAYGVSYSK